MYGPYTRHLAEQANAEAQKWRAAGYQAKMDGSVREVPSMISPMAETAWLRGYDDAAIDMEIRR